MFGIQIKIKCLTNSNNYFSHSDVAGKTENIILASSRFIQTLLFGHL